MADQTSVIVSSVKPGWKTTEFILSGAVSIFTLLLTFKGIVPPNVAAIIISVVTGVYTIARSIVKIYDPAYSAPDLPAGV